MLLHNCYPSMVFGYKAAKMSMVRDGHGLLVLNTKVTVNCSWPVDAFNLYDSYLCNTLLSNLLEIHKYSSKPIEHS